MTTRRDFAGGDQAYLREVQYADASKLAARSRLHVEASTATTPWFDWLAAQIDWPDGARVVEAGCGPGLFWVERPPTGMQLVLTDQSMGMVAAARTNVPLATQVVADVQALPFPSGSADVVVANHMLCHAPSPERGVVELARVLRPDGTALISTNGAAHMQELTMIVQEVFPHDADLMSFVDSVFGRETGEPMLRRHFADVEWRPYRDDLVSRDPEVVMGYLTSFPPGEQASSAQRAAMRRAVDEAFDVGQGTMRIAKDTGAFVGRRPTTSSC